MTSGESDTEVVIRVVRPVSVDIHTVRIEVAGIHELTIRITASLLYSSFFGNSNSYFQYENRFHLYKYVTD